MSVPVKDLLMGMRIANKEGMPSQELLEVIQQLVAAKRDLEARVAALEALHP